MFIQVNNIVNNEILGTNFTVYGTFSVSMRPKEDKERKLVRYMPSFGPTFSCQLLTSTGTLWATGTCTRSTGVWQADFVNVRRGSGLKLVYSITSGGATQNGTPITGLEVRIPLEITVSNSPPVTAGSGTMFTYNPNGDFGLDPGQVLLASDGFSSAIVVNGAVADLKQLTNLEVLITSPVDTWQLDTTHDFNRPLGTSASHVIRIKMNDGSSRLTSRPGL